MDNNNNSGLIGVIALAAAALLVWKLLPGLFKIASVLVAAAIVICIIVIAIMVVYAIKTPVKKQRGGVETGEGDLPPGEAATDKAAKKNAASALGGAEEASRDAADSAMGGGSSREISGADLPEELKKAKKCLLDIMTENVRIRDMEVRSLSSEVSASAGKIIDTLADQPEDIRKCRQFYNYYLPTYLQIMRRYRKLETSGLEIGDVRTELLSYMKRISSALDKQYEMLFDNDKFDLSVEMEALDLSLRKSGLLTEEEIPDAASSEPSGGAADAEVAEPPAVMKNEQTDN